VQIGAENKVELEHIAITPSMFSITVIVLLVAVLHLASRGQLTTSIWCVDHQDA
jgi:hypothetical protein